MFVCILGIFLLDIVAERAIFILSETSVELLFIWDVLTNMGTCLHIRNFSPEDFIHTGLFLYWAVAAGGVFFYWGVCLHGGCFCPGVKSVPNTLGFS